MIRSKFRTLVLLALVGFTFMQFDVPPQSQEKSYSLLMLGFAKGIQWPKQSEGSNFVIGVLEYPPLTSELTSIASSTKIGTRKIEVKEFSHASEVKDCHILFIPAYKAKQLEVVLGKLGNKPTLIITNKMDLAKKGSGVNFVLIEGKLKFEINCQSIEKRGMKVSSNIKGMGIIVG